MRLLNILRNCYQLLHFFLVQLKLCGADYDLSKPHKFKYDGKLDSLKDDFLLLFTSRICLKSAAL